MSSPKLIVLKRLLENILNHTESGKEDRKPPKNRNIFSIQNLKVFTKGLHTFHLWLIIFTFFTADWTNIKISILGDCLN